VGMDRHVREGITNCNEVSRSVAARTMPWLSALWSLPGPVQASLPTRRAPASADLDAETHTVRGVVVFQLHPDAESVPTLK